MGSLIPEWTSNWIKAKLIAAFQPQIDASDFVVLDQSCRVVKYDRSGGLQPGLKLRLGRGSRGLHEDIARRRNAR